MRRGYVGTVTTHLTVQMVPLPCLVCVETPEPVFWTRSNTMFTWMLEKL